MLFRLRADAAAESHRQELEQSMLEKAVEEEAERERDKLKAAQTKWVVTFIVTWLPLQLNVSAICFINAH